MIAGQQIGKEFSLEEMLRVERPRLVRLCARLSGSKEASEDLAQEVLLTAWRHADRLADPEQYPPWLSAIARNVCLNWSRSYYREQSRVAAQEQTEAAVTLNDNLPDDFDLEVELERDELASLLERAMALLPAETRTALVAHYIEESPHAEVAAQLGLSPGAVAARLHRGKLALRKVLTSTLREELAPYCVIADTDTWQETRVWCTSCGRQRFMIRIAQPSGTISFRCPACNPDPVSVGSEYRTANTAFRQLVGGLSSPRSILNRTATWTQDYYVPALDEGVALCSNCGHRVQPRRFEPGDTLYESHTPNGVYFYCERCGEAISSSLEGLVVSLPQVQRFWRKHNRIRTIPEHMIETAGQEAFVISFESITSAARIDVVSALDTFKLISIHGDLDRAERRQ